MLEEMRITDLGVIADATLTFGPGLCVVTGETGAGKTMVVTGLGLLLGGRADSGLVRAGTNRATVEGRFRVDPSGPVAERVREAGGELDDDGTLLVSRSVSADGRSRAHVGGRSVPVGVLGELAEHLVTVHGQSDQLALLRPAVQRELLDRYAGPAVLEPRADYSDTFARHRAAAEHLRELTERARERTQEADLLRFGLDEVTSVAPEPGEDRRLADEVSRLAHADGLRLAATEAHTALAGDDDASESPDAQTLLGQARAILESAAAHDPALAELARRVAEAGFLVADAASDLAAYAESLEADPARLAAAQERLAAVTRLTKKYADVATASDGADAVLAWAATAAARLAELDGDGDRGTDLAAECERLSAQLAALAERLTGARRAAATALGAAVGDELTALAMPHARLAVAVESAELGPTGADAIEFRLAPHADSTPRTLQRGASGGELSRVMLALEVVLAGADATPTFVFDEVDAGVGGRAAVEVGRRLARLAGSAQVVAVTHLPQVAAFADVHLAVEKSIDGAVVASDVTVLDDTDRVAELSRMLAGHESDLARGHAEELLAAAAADRRPPGRRSGRR